MARRHEPATENKLKSTKAPKSTILEGIQIINRKKFYQFRF